MDGYILFQKKNINYTNLV